MADTPSEIPSSPPDRPFYRWLGLEVQESSPDGTGTVSLAYRPELCNSRGNVHGGAVASLLDAAVSAAVRSALQDRGKATMVTMTVAFLEPGQGTLVARGRVIRCGRAVAVAQGEVVDEKGVLVGHGMATFRVYPKQSTPSS